MNIIGVIPARYESSRLPGKPLADICGKPMIWWVYQKVMEVKELSEVIVATDDARIMEVCQQLKMNVIMTSNFHDTPTSRLYEVSTKIDADLYLMVMGDEPLVDTRCFSLIIPPEMPFDYQVAVLTNMLIDPAEVIDFSNQKIVTNAERNTLMISRSPIPYPKGTLAIQYEKVTGVQIFSKTALDFFAKTSKSVLEEAEENDLMRFVEHGINVRAILSPYKTISVDTKKDLEEVRKMIAKI